MKVTVLGGTGRTGQPLVTELRRRGHQVTVLVRDPDNYAVAATTVVKGSSTDRAALTQAVSGADAIVSALGPTGKESDLHTTTAGLIVDLLPSGGRFIGISGTGIDVPGDEKGTRDKIVSFLIQKLGGALVQDKHREYQVYSASDLDWTLARPPRLMDGPGTGSYYANAHRPGRSSSIKRADLALFLADCLDQHLYRKQAPFVAGK